MDATMHDVGPRTVERFETNKGEIAARLCTARETGEALRQPTSGASTYCVRQERLNCSTMANELDVPMRSPAADGVEYEGLMKPTLPF